MYSFKINFKVSAMMAEWYRTWVTGKEWRAQETSDSYSAKQREPKQCDTQDENNNLYYKQRFPAGCGRAQHL